MNEAKVHGGYETVLWQTLLSMASDIDENYIPIEAPILKFDMKASNQKRKYGMITMSLGIPDEIIENPNSCIHLDPREMGIQMYLFLNKKYLSEEGLKTAEDSKQKLLDMMNKYTELNLLFNKFVSDWSDALAKIEGVETE